MKFTFETEPRTSHMKDDGLASLVGLKVTEAFVNADKDVVVLKTADGDRYLSWHGDCCAHCFLANVEGAENLKGAEILTVECAEWVQGEDKENYEVIDSMGTKIKTTKGYVALETRVEHNGYYGGEISVSKICPIGQYSNPMYGEKNNVVEFTELQDF